MNTFYILLLSLFFALPASNKSTISSPDGKLQFVLSEDGGKLTFTVFLNGEKVVEESPLLMSLDGLTITEGIKTGKIKKFSESYDYQTLGLHSGSKNNCNGASISLNHKITGTKYTIGIKGFDDAVAFRFIVPGDESSLRKPDEATSIKLPAGSISWYHDLYMHYEGVHKAKLVDTIPAGQWAAPPVTVKLPGSSGYLSMTEANLTGYAGMAFQSDGGRGFVMRLGHSHPASYPYVLRYSKEDVERLSKIAEVKGTITTPWRVIIVAKDLNALVNCDAINNLCPAPDKLLFPEGIRTGWIKPGRAVWRYLDGGGDNSLGNMKKFSRKAAEMGFEYNILEGFWNKWPDDSIKALVDFSKKMDVGVIVWKHSRDLRDSGERKKFFQRLSDLGIAGIKIDFFDHEAKEMIDLYESIFREAAAMKLSLILHGANKPTGLARTYPNVLIYEAVRGMESSKLMERASHETTLPFTRMIAGPADYSVCHFGDRRRNTTWVHQVASAAIYSAPVLTYAANPDNLLSNPCLNMIKSIPPVWDETIVLSQSEIGESAIFAQRKGADWFLSVMNGVKPKSFTIPLSFLGGYSYSTYILEDDPENPASVIISEKQSTRDEVITLSLGEGGGYMVRFIPK